jgi:hypothetical protein
LELQTGLLLRVRLSGRKLERLSGLWQKRLSGLRRWRLKDHARHGDADGHLLLSRASLRHRRVDLLAHAGLLREWVSLLQLLRERVEDGAAWIRRHHVLRPIIIVNRKGGLIEKLRLREARRLWRSAGDARRRARRHDEDAIEP